MLMVTDMPMPTEPSAQMLLSLQSWLSPAFPIGGYSYSHGLEYAHEAGLVHDADSVADWLAADLEHGSGRIDAMLLAAACRPPDDAKLLELAALAAALRGTAELALETGQQGRAFLAGVRRVWPTAELDRLVALLDEAGVAPVLPLAVGLACRGHGIPLPAVLPLYLQSWVANLVHAAVRLIPLGQTDGLHVIRRLEEVVLRTAEAAQTDDIEEIGSAALMVDWSSMQHETQTTRLFRS
jgi:urease accessory protein